MDSRSSGKAPAPDTGSVILEILKELSPSGLTEVKPETELVAELGFDSLGLVELLVALEDTLGLPPIDTEAMGRLDCVADLEGIVLRAQAGLPLARASE
jgi:acyl carrier protein